MEGACNKIDASCKKIHAQTLTPSPTLPRKRGREQTEFAARAHSIPRENAERYWLTTTLRIAVFPSLVAASALCSAPSNSARFSTRSPWKPKWLPNCS
jgi:hypothetical protein